MDTTSTCFYELYDAEVYEAFIKSVEKLFRLSPEYKMWLSTTDNQECAVTGLSKDSIEIEVHHYGKTLWAIVEEILDYFIQNDIFVNSFYICLILTDLHLNGCVDYIPLAHDIHKMLHKNASLAYATYPDLESHVVRGNAELKKQIIKKWANRLKTNFKDDYILED